MNDEQPIDPLFLTDCDTKEKYAYAEKLLSMSNEALLDELLYLEKSDWFDVGDQWRLKKAKELFVRKLKEAGFL